MSNSATLNTSGLKPLGVAVLVESHQPERKAGRILIPDSVQGRQAAIEDRAIVIAVGEHAWADEPTPRAKPGDLVLVAKFSGYMATGPADGKLYRVINDRDIFCAITAEAVEEKELENV